MKNNKTNASKYVTVGNEHKGMSYKEISTIMTNSGHKMNHSSVRHHILKSFAKIASHMVDYYELDYTKEKIDEISKSPEFQHAVIDLLKKEKG